MLRTERWTIERDGRTETAMVDVRDDRTVVVAVELLSQMLLDLGFVRTG